MSAIGTWTLTMKTPMGDQKNTIVITDSGGSMTGPNGETQEVTDLKLDGDKITWKSSITKPMPLKLHFNVTVDGDKLSGTCKPGMFPASAVTGVRS